MMPGALGLGPHLQPEGAAEVPLGEARHRAGVGSPIEEAGVPLLSTNEVGHGAVGEQAVDHRAS